MYLETTNIKPFRQVCWAG